MNSISFLSLGYLSRLNQYTSEISDIAAGISDAAFTRNDYTIIPKFKGDEGSDAIYRPLCVYNNLDTKILISAASAYFTQCFDAYLHEEILSYRPRRMYHGVNTTTSGNDAIRRIRQYLEEHRGQKIYVAECDIQKFFDIINHDVVLDCFDRLAQKAGIPDYHQVRNILKAYLDSYGFVPNSIRDSPRDAKKMSILPSISRLMRVVAFIGRSLRNSSYSRDALFWS